MINYHSAVNASARQKADITDDYYVQVSQNPPASVLWGLSQRQIPQKYDSL